METLHVRMLGGFILHYGNEEIILGRNTTAKFVQLLQMVWLEGNKGISKTQIVRYLYEADELSNPNNSFNNLVFQMRRQMEAAGLPKKDYIIKRGKVFIPDPGVPLTIDVLDFNSYIDQARALRTCLRPLPGGTSAGSRNKDLCRKGRCTAASEIQRSREVAGELYQVP